MKRLVAVVIVGILAWQGYLYYRHGMHTAAAGPADVVEPSPDDFLRGSDVKR